VAIVNAAVTGPRDRTDDRRYAPANAFAQRFDVDLFDFANKPKIDRLVLVILLRELPAAKNIRAGEAAGFASGILNGIHDFRIDLARQNSIDDFNRCLISSPMATNKLRFNS